MTDTVPHKAHSRLVPAPREDLCLAFADTRYWRGSDEPTETLRSFADVLAWCESEKSLDRASARDLLKWETEHKSKAAALFGEVIAARETIYGVFSATASGKAPAGKDVDTLNRLLDETPGRDSVAIAGGGNMWRAPPAQPNAASLLAPVLWSAGDLLVGDRLPRVRLCANEKCDWIFLDDSKSGTRRWCAMSACGNRAKAHRHYMRKTQENSKHDS
jgi:predicted RNA-binding Zn ribbon-like protein